jgi:hypothetical protein
MFAFTSKVNSQILIENFEYSVGAQLTANGWTAQTAGSGINPVSVIPGSLSYSGYSASGIGNMVSIAGANEDVYKTFTSVNSGTVYVAGIFNFSLVTTTGDYFFHFIGQTTSNFIGRLFIKKDANNKLAFGLMKNSGGTTPYTAYDYDLNTDYLVILKYTFNSVTTTDDVAEIFISPANLSSEPAIPTFSQSANTDATQLAGIAIRQGGATAAPSVKIDGIRIATTWADVIGAPTLPPVWTSGWPKSENATNNGFTAKVNIDIPGNAYFVVLPNGATAPNATQVKAGQDANGNSLAANLKGTISCTLGNTEYTSNVTGLSAATTYNIYYISENNSFLLQTTPVMNSLITTSGSVVPVVSNPTASGISYNTALLGGDVTSDGGSPILSRGTVWSTTSGVTISNNYLEEGVATTGVFTHQRTGLPSKAQIFYKAFATNIVGPSLSTESSFFTLGEKPVSHVATFTATAASTTQIDLSWVIPPVLIADGFLIIRKQGATAPTGLPVDATGYSIGSAIGDGIVAAEVLSGSATFVQITGLTPMTQYSFTIIPYAYDGLNYQTYSYNTNPVIPSASITTLTPPATTYTWNVTTGSGLYTDPANWTPSRTTPSSNDILLINNGLIDTIHGLTTQSIGQLKIDSNTTVYLQAASTATLNILGYTGIDFTISLGSKLNIFGSNALTIKLLTTATGIINGEITYSGGLHKMDAIDAGSIAFESGSIITQDIGCTGNIFTNSGTANVIVFKNGSTFIQKAGSNPFGLTAPNSKIIFEQGSLLKLAANLTPSFSGRTYADFELDALGSTITTTGTSAVSINNLTITNGNLYFNVTLIPGHSIKGNIHVSAGQTLYFNPLTAGTINLNGTTSQTISGSGTIKTNKFSNLVINNSNGININDSLTIGGTLTFTNGNITLGANITLDSTSIITGTLSATSMIIPNSFKIFKIFNPQNMSNNFIFPIGEGTKYLPVSLTTNTGMFGNDNFISLGMENQKHPNDLSTGNYLNRYWKLAQNGIFNLSYDAIFQYDINDVVGSENLILCKNFSINPPLSYSNANTTLHTLSVNGTYDIGDFGGGEDLSTKTLNLTLLLEGLFNGIAMNPANDENGFHWGANVADHITVELHNSTTYLTEATFSDQNLNTDGTCNVNIPAAYGNSYYIAIKHRNSVQTWSSLPVSFTGSAINYNFSNSVANSYGDNIKEVATGIYAIYVGDVNQDEVVDLSDLVQMDTDLTAGTVAYIVYDLNGDGVVDLSDLVAIDENLTNGVVAMFPQ